MNDLCSCFIRNKLNNKKSNIILLNINTNNCNLLLKSFSIEINTLYLNDYIYIYKLFRKKLIEIYNQLINNTMLIIYSIDNNNNKKYIYMSILNPSLILNLEDIKKKFYLKTTVLLDHEINIININNNYIEKLGDKQLYYLYSKIRNYLNINGLKIFNKYLMLLLNKYYNIELRYANYNLLNDKYFLLPLMEFADNWELICNPHKYNQQYILPDHIKNDEELIIASFKSPYIDKFVFIDFPIYLRNNKNIVLAAIETEQCLVLSNTSEKIKNEIISNSSKKKT
jgi:hypothetical protein